MKKRKKIIFASALLILISLAGCSQEKNPVSTEPDVSVQPTAKFVTGDQLDCKSAASSAKAEDMRTFISRNCLQFDYEIGWQILHRGFVEEPQDFWQGTFATRLIRLDRIDINFQNPHDIGPYGSGVDIAIQDILLEGPPSSPKEFIKKMQTSFEQDGLIKQYRSQSGVDFTVWRVPDPTYEADNVYYITEYNDPAGQKHFVEISRMGAEYEAIEQKMLPIVDTFRLPQ